MKPLQHIKSGKFVDLQVKDIMRQIVWLAVFACLFVIMMLCGTLVKNPIDNMWITRFGFAGAISCLLMLMVNSSIYWGNHTPIIPKE